MSTIELKTQIHDYVERLEDEDFVQAIHMILGTHIAGKSEDVKDYNMDGTPQFASAEEMKTELDRRLASAKQGNSVTVEELRKKYEGRIEEKADLEKIKREQGFTGIDKDKMTQLAQKANIKEPLEDLLNMLTP